jgi:hypothetical protein
MKDMADDDGRRRLPNRRHNLTVEMEYDGKAFVETISFADDGTPLEIFADGYKEGSSMQAILDDACIIISIALQYGATKEQLAHSLGRVPAFHDGRETEIRASVIGALVDAIETRPELMQLAIEHKR